ncbi:hypothetical protein BDF22DRAFT_656935 [Syncephalis plumigaleata]|nr:hypothetical protein BDF22DRAFT_656935 [Syncephalis plumigaleata]
MEMEAKQHSLAVITFWAVQFAAFYAEAKNKTRNIQLVQCAVNVAFFALLYAMDTTYILVILIWCINVADIFLGLSKLLRYTGHEQWSNGLFVLFMISWFVTRHGFFLQSIYAMEHYWNSLNVKSCHSFIDYLANQSQHPVIPCLLFVLHLGFLYYEKSIAHYIARMF